MIFKISSKPNIDNYMLSPHLSSTLKRIEPVLIDVHYPKYMITYTLTIVFQKYHLLYTLDVKMIMLSHDSMEIHSILNSSEVNCDNNPLPNIQSV